MITINSGKLIIPEEERFIGFAGDNLHSRKQFLIENKTDKNCIYRLYLKFDDGTVNYFVLDSKVENGSTILTWDISEEHIFKSGIVSAQIKSISDNLKVYHTTWDYFYAGNSAEFSEEFRGNENAEFLRYEKELNEIYIKINETDLDSFVSSDITIAGLNLKDSIYTDELYDALKIYPIMIREGAPTFNYGEIGRFLVDTLNGDFYYCDKRTLSGYNWIKLTGNSESSSALKKAEINENGELILTMADDTTNNLGVVVGKDGADGNDGYSPVKGIDYFTDEDKQEIIDELKADKETNNDTIPEYWQSALDEGTKAINTALANAGYNKSAFLFYSDAHFDYGSQISPKLLKYLYNHTGLNKTFFGGDIVNSEDTDYDTMQYLWTWRNMLKDLPNHHSVVGNHDDGNATNNLFTEQYVYSYLLSAEETPYIVRGDNGMYYYIDNSPEKTRYIFLDTAYKGMNSDQIAFLKEALINTKNGWHIVVISHIWYAPDYDRYDERPVPLTGLSSDASTVTAMLDNYNSRVGDFADCNAWVEFCIGGHIHYDYDATTSTGIPIILVETDSQHTRGNYSYTAGTTTEASVNGIVADYDNHKIYVVRIGRGESREITVTNYQISYTNVLSTALDADGVSVYNKVGYKADTRWSESGQAESTLAGTYLTGYIPVSSSDVIRLANITANSSNFKLLKTTTLGSSEGSWQYSQVISDLGGEVDSNGNIVKFTIPSGSGSFYIRFACGGIDDTSIITINEEIA